MKVDIGNMQVAVWQTEEAIEVKRLELERADDAGLGEVLGRSLAGLESLLVIQQRMLDFLVRQDRQLASPPPPRQGLIAASVHQVALDRCRDAGQAAMSRISRR